MLKTHIGNFLDIPYNKRLKTDNTPRNHSTSNEFVLCSSLKIFKSKEN